MLEQAFGCSLVNTYGCGEHLRMGAAPPGASNIVLTDHDLVYEFYPDHSVVTNLFNYTMPLIRYRMSDVLRPVELGAHAPYLVIESLVSRNELQPVFKNGDGDEDFISPHTINEIFVAGVTRFQMHLLGPEAFRFMVCLDSALDAEQRAAAIKGVCDRLSEILARKRMGSTSRRPERTAPLPLRVGAMASTCSGRSWLSIAPSSPRVRRNRKPQAESLAASRPSRRLRGRAQRIRSI